MALKINFATTCASLGGGPVHMLRRDYGPGSKSNRLAGE
jgi:hypothetical protein